MNFFFLSLSSCVMKIKKKSFKIANMFLENISNEIYFYDKSNFFMKIVNLQFNSNSWYLSRKYLPIFIWNNLHTYNLQYHGLYNETTFTVWNFPKISTWIQPLKFPIYFSNVSLNHICWIFVNVFVPTVLSNLAYSYEKKKKKNIPLNCNKSKLILNKKKINDRGKNRYIICSILLI